MLTEGYNSSSDEESNQYLPIMQPDIVLESNNRKVVLDTKYYKEALKEYHGRKKTAKTSEDQTRTGFRFIYEKWFSFCNNHP